MAAVCETHESDLPPLRQVTTRHGAIAYRSAGGDGAPVLVMLHGISSGSASWAGQLAGLPARGLRVIAWDAPGYGGSDPLPMPAPRASDYAAALGDLAEALGLARFHLLGHSLGAVMAAAFLRQPGAARIARLVLAAPAAGYGSASVETRRARIDGRLADMAQFGPEGIAARRAPALLSPQATPATVERIRAVMRQLHPEGYAQAVRMLGQADLFADAAAIGVPSLVLCGGADTVTPEEGCRRVAAAIRGARFALLPGLGHACYVEDAAAFNRVVVDFIGGEGRA